MKFLRIMFAHREYRPSRIGSKTTVAAGHGRAPSSGGESGLQIRYSGSKNGKISKMCFRSKELVQGQRSWLAPIKRQSVRSWKSSVKMIGMRLTGLPRFGILQRPHQMYRPSKSMHLPWCVVVTRSLDLQRKRAMTIAEPLQRRCGRSVVPMWSWWLHGRMGMGGQWLSCRWHIGNCNHQN